MNNKSVTKNYWLKFLIVIPAIAWAVFGLYHALDGYTIQDFMNNEIWLAFGLIPVLISMAGCVFKQTRLVAIISFLLVVISGISATQLRSHRLTVGVQQLTAIYRNIAAHGQPFPLTINKASYENPAFLHWYYQRNSEKSFAIVYIVSSDGWAMEYPDGIWRSIGYKPDGYEPDKSDTVETSKTESCPVCHSSNTITSVDKVLNNTNEPSRNIAVWNRSICANLAHPGNSAVCTNCWYGHDVLTDKWELAKQTPTGFARTLRKEIAEFPLPEKSAVTYFQEITNNSVVDKISFWTTLDTKYEQAIKAYAKTNGISLEINRHSKQKEMYVCAGIRTRTKHSKDVSDKL